MNTKPGKPSITAEHLPPVGARIGSECGPGEFAAHNGGTVTEHVNSRFGTYAVVKMDDGGEETCHGMRDAPGIGWHYI